MKASAYEKMVAELARCGWKTLPITHKVWMSEGSFKDRNERNQKIAELQAANIANASTHTNYKGTTVWAEREGIVLRMVRPVMYKWTGEFRMIAEFTTEGAYIRGYSHQDTPYVPNRYGCRQSVGETLKELMHLIQVYSPENIEKIKKADIQAAKVRIQEALTKRAEYEAKVQKTKDAVVDLIKGPFSSYQAIFDSILREGLLVLPFHKEYGEEDIEEAKAELEKLQG